MNGISIRTGLLRCAVALCLLLAAALAQAAPPRPIAYQGYLTSNTGVPVNGTLTMKFSLYGESSGGSPLWTETQSATVVNGNYNVFLGNSTPLDLPFDAEYWLGVKVNDDAEMSPRALLTHVPYAFRAVTATTAGTASSYSGTISGSQITGTVTNATISGGTLAQLQGQFVSGLQPTSVSANAQAAVDTAGSVGFYSSITVGADGLPVISYYDQTNADLKVAKCGNAACTSGNTITAVDTAGDVGRFTSSTIGADGLPVISYYDASNGDLKVAKCGNAACSAGNTITIVDAAGNVGVFSSITIGADGLPVISYYDFTSFDLKVAKCGNAACSAGNTLTAVDTAGDVGLYTSVTIGADGLPVISYYDNTNFDLKVAKCGNAACSAGNTITAVDTAGNVGVFTSIAIGADGLPVISYQDQSNADLKVAKCGNAACSAGNAISAPDTAGIVGQFSSIAVGADGLPVISYYDASNNDLKVAKCGNAACSAGNTISAPDTAGTVGEYPSITIGADGLPLISYYDASNGDLKVAKCANAFCAPYFRRR